MADIRIFSYLPNPRLFKATIAARYSGATIEIIGTKPRELATWLWDYDARELPEEERSQESPYARIAKTGFQGTLFKTDAFLKANPFGDVPAAFGDDGAVGLFESNSIMRAAARLGSDAPALYGGGPLQQSRIDGFLDRALIFARDSQRYLLSRQSGISKALYTDMDNALTSYLSGVDQALSADQYLAGPDLTLADIAFACEICLFSNEIYMQPALDDANVPPLLPKLFDYKNASAHLGSLSNEPNFSQDLGSYFEKIFERQPTKA